MTLQKIAIKIEHQCFLLIWPLRMTSCQENDIACSTKHTFYTWKVTLSVPHTWNIHSLSTCHFMCVDCSVQNSCAVYLKCCCCWVCCDEAALDPHWTRRAEIVPTYRTLNKYSYLRLDYKWLISFMNNSFFHACMLWKCVNWIFHKLHFMYIW